MNLDRARVHQPGGHAVVRELCTIADARLVDVRTLHRAVCADDYFHDHREAVFVGIE
jgi:hypothetical protein